MRNIQGRNPFSHLFRIAAFSIMAIGCLAFAKKVVSPKTAHAAAPGSPAENMDQQKLFTEPVDSHGAAQAIAQFEADHITDAGLNYAPIKIRMVPALKRVFTLFSDDEYSCMTFHYALSNDKKELYYIIAPGTKLKSTEELYYRPFLAGMYNQSEDHYILLSNTPNDAIQYISVSRFCSFTENYELNMKKKVGGIYVPIQNDSIHPYYVYHEGKELNLFFEEYIKGSRLYLHLKHGVMKPPGVTDYYHAACFLFGDDRESFPLNNVDYPNAGLDAPYRGKALNIGNLCPPMCAVPPRSSCP